MDAGGHYSHAGTRFAHTNLDADCHYQYTCARHTDACPNADVYARTSHVNPHANSHGHGGGSANSDRHFADGWHA